MFPDATKVLHKVTTIKTETGQWIRREGLTQTRVCKNVTYSGRSPQTGGTEVGYSADGIGPNG